MLWLKVLDNGFSMLIWDLAQSFGSKQGEIEQGYISSNKEALPLQELIMVSCVIIWFA